MIKQRNRVLPIARRGDWRVRQPGGRPYPIDIPCVLLILAIVLSSGCANVPTDKEFRATSAVLPAAAAGINGDGRSRFRHIFCALAEDQGVLTKRRNNSCEALLWRLADEAPSEANLELPPLDSRLQVFVVGGSFSDCFGPASMAFPHAIERLVGEGYPVGTLAISSRSSADYNARMIAEGLAKAPERPIVLIGYSKGAVDIAHFLVNYPDMAKQVVAVVSVAGPLMGSEIAAYGEWAYDTFFTGSFAGRCDPGDGGVLDSLQPQVRRDWLVSHPLPETVRFYTLLAFADREHMARALRPTWDILASSDPRNDGQVTIREGTWPNSTLLGYANADHWGVATEIEEEFDFLASRPDDIPYPRGVLFEAALRFVSEDLRDRLVSDAQQGADL